MTSQIRLAALGVLLVLLPSISHSTTSQIRSKVYGTLTGTDYNQCMVQVDQFPADSGLSCPDNSDRVWLTFDCKGQWLPKSVADSNFKQAQVAMLAGSKLSILVDDARKSQGWCLATRVIHFR